MHNTRIYLHGGSLILFAHLIGLSGRPVREISTEIIRKMFIYTNGQVPIIGVGGVEDGKTAYEKIRAGACAVEVYSMLSYKGLGMVRKIKLELQELLHSDGFDSVVQAVGVDAKVKQEAGAHNNSSRTP